jgi:SNF2 family DNA or RNA helicase
VIFTAVCSWACWSKKAESEPDEDFGRVVAPAQISTTLFWWMRIITAIGQVQLLLDTLDTLNAEGHKALVFSQFVQMLTIVRTELDARKISYTYLDGQTTARQEQVDRFQNDPRIPFFLISLKAGGLGLNLTAADYVIHIDPWWNPAAEMQASDRTHRIGQEKPVFVFKLIARLGREKIHCSKSGKSNWSTRS